MKTHATLLISITLLMGMSVAGCNKLQESRVTSDPAITVKAEVPDNEVTTRVKTALLYDQNVGSFDIAVATLKGDVKLTGEVDTQQQKDDTIKLVRSIDGVHSIHDELGLRSENNLLKAGSV